MMSILSKIFNGNKKEGKENMQKEKSELFQKVEKVINEDIRPFIESDGGMIILNDVSDGVVYVELAGACAGCPGATMTLKGGVERILQQKISEVIQVALVR